MNAIMVPRDQKRRVVQFRKRGFRRDHEQQRRQRYAEQEKIHPGKAGFGQRLSFTAGEADEDRAEIRHGEIKNIDHFRAMIVAACGAAPGRRKG
jgi:hypothetical protein